MPEPEIDQGLGKFAEAYRKAGPYLNLGWTFAAAVGLGCFAGWWLDKKLGTAPWLLVAGSVLGMTAAFISFFRTISALGKKKR